MGLFWSGATPVFSSVPCPMTRLLKTVTRAQTLLKMQKFPLTGKVLKLQIFPPAGNSGPSEQQNGGGIVMIPPPRSLRRAYAVSCKETKNPNPLPMANRFGFLDFVKLQQFGYFSCKPCAATDAADDTRWTKASDWRPISGLRTAPERAHSGGPRPSPAQSPCHRSKPSCVWKGLSFAVFPP